jgi:hypothetical protein
VSGGIDPTPLQLQEDDTAGVDGLTRYDAPLPTPATIGPAGPSTTWRVETVAGVQYRDIVVALWCSG